MAAAMSGSVNRLPTSSRNIAVAGVDGARPQASDSENSPPDGERTIYVSDDGLLVSVRIRCCALSESRQLRVITDNFNFDSGLRKVSFILHLIDVTFFCDHAFWCLKKLIEVWLFTYIGIFLLWSCVVKFCKEKCYNSDIVVFLFPNNT